MEPKRARRGWLERYAQCIVMKDMDLPNINRLLTTAALQPGCGLHSGSQGGLKTLLFLIAQVRKKK